MPICVVCNEVIEGDVVEHLVGVCEPLLQQFGPVGKLKVKGANGRTHPATIADLDRLLADDGTEPKLVPPAPRVKPGGKQPGAAYRQHYRTQTGDQA